MLVGGSLSALDEARLRLVSCALWREVCRRCAAWSWVWRRGCCALSWRDAVAERRPLAAGGKSLRGDKASVASEDCNAIDSLPLRRLTEGRCCSPKAWARGDVRDLPFCVGCGVSV